MKTSQEIEKEFKEELNNLFKKYNACIELDIRGNACANMIIVIDIVYDSEGGSISPYAQIDLGGAFYPE